MQQTPELLTSSLGAQKIQKRPQGMDFRKTTALLLLGTFAGAVDGAPVKTSSHGHRQSALTAKAVKAKKPQGRQYPNAITSLFAIDDEDPTLVYADKNSLQRWIPASTTKLMFLMVAEDIRRNPATNISWRTPVTITREAANSEAARLGSGAHLRVGTVMSLEDAYHFGLLPSDNLVIGSMPSALGRSKQAMLNLMNEKKDRIGMKDTNFTNLEGWEDDNQYTNARDETLMMREVLHHYPELVEIMRKKSFPFRGVTYENHNDLLTGKTGPAIPDILGKTGMAGGFNIVVANFRGKECVIACELGARNIVARRDDMASTLENAFSRRAALMLARQPVMVNTELQTRLNDMLQGLMKSLTLLPPLPPPK